MSAFVLKLIAAACMGIDHIGAVFTGTPFIFRAIGRIAFPIYVFLIAEGCVHTKNRYKYMLRLGLFALISEIPFDLAFKQFSEINFLDFTNVFYTLFLGVACVNAYEFIREIFKEKADPVVMNVLAVLPALLLMVLGEMLGTDYGLFGIAWIFIMYLAGTKNKRLFVMFAGVVYKYGQWLVNPQYADIYSILILSLALFSVVLVFFYNGTRGRKLKWAFYCYYPAHLLLLAALSQKIFIQ